MELKEEKVLLLVAGSSCSSDSQENVTKLTFQQLLDSKSENEFDKIIYKQQQEEEETEKNLNEQILQQILKHLKADAKFSVYTQAPPAAAEEERAKRIISQLKFAGFTSVVHLVDEQVVEAKKPNYGLNSSIKLNFSSSNSNKIWQLKADDFDDNDDEMIDESELLDADDLKKPSAESLRVCSTTGKRKACADCSCGLAEELDAEDQQKIRENTQNAKSSCGSCYLGDAFRCAACPYRGLPAFKPGEKVVLDSSSDDLLL